MSLFFVFSLIISAAILGALISKAFKLPYSVGYLLTGSVIGTIYPAIQSEHIVSLISDIGIVLLLFTIGIECSLDRIKNTFLYLVPYVLAQVAAVAVFFLFLFVKFGFGYFEALVISVSISLASTAVTVKNLTDNSETDTVYGHLAASWLIIQDFFSILILFLFPILYIWLNREANFSNGLEFLSRIVILGFVSVISVIFSRFFFPIILGWSAINLKRETYLSIIIGLVFFFTGILFLGGVSPAIGAFIAGLIIAPTVQNHQVLSEIRPLRDLFVIFFFVSMGISISGSYLLTHGFWILNVIIIILFIKFIISYTLIRISKKHRHIAFRTAINILSMSEFGLILARTAILNNYISPDTYNLIASLTFALLIISSILSLRSEDLYHRIFIIMSKRLPRLFSVRRNIHSEEINEPENHVIVIGFGRVGRYIARVLDMCSIRHIVIEYNLSTFNGKNSPHGQFLLGDPSEPDILKQAGIEKARAVIITVPDWKTQHVIINNLNNFKADATIFCRTHHENEQKLLSEMGVQHIVQPEFEASVAILNKLLTGYGLSKDTIKIHIAKIENEHRLKV